VPMADFLHLHSWPLTLGDDADGGDQHSGARGAPRGGRVRVAAGSRGTGTKGSMAARRLTALMPRPSIWTSMSKVLAIHKNARWATKGESG
jgi:hypothetical protein